MQVKRNSEPIALVERDSWALKHFCARCGEDPRAGQVSSHHIPGAPFDLQTCF